MISICLLEDYSTTNPICSTLSVRSDSSPSISIYTSKLRSGRLEPSGTATEESTDVDYGFIVDNWSRMYGYGAEGWDCTVRKSACNKGKRTSHVEPSSKLDIGSRALASEPLSCSSLSIIGDLQ
jgi:hypothetical protein